MGHTVGVNGSDPTLVHVQWILLDFGDDGWHVTFRIVTLAGQWVTETHSFDELDDALELMRDVAKEGI